MRRILIVAYYYPPLATSGAMRPLAFSRWLPEHGWRPSVLTIEPECVEAGVDVDPGLELRIDPSVRVLRVPYMAPRTRLVRWKAALSRRGPSVSRRKPSSQRPQPSPKLPGRRSPVAFGEALFERFLGFPDACAAWIGPAVRRASRDLRHEPPDIVFATAPPWSALIAGSRLAHAFGVPLVVDFRDPWTRNPVQRTVSAWAERHARVIEGELVRAAGLVIANTEESREQLSNCYPDAAPKIRTITNGFDPELFQDANGAPVIARPLELCHFGSLYGQRSPLQLLRALLQLQGRDADLSHRLRVRLIGPWEVEHEETNALAAALEGAGVVVREPAIPHALCLEAMRRGTVLLVLQPASPVQIPGKLYEYIASGRPLLLVGGEGATEALVERHQLGVRTRNEQSEIAAALQAMLDRPESLPLPQREEIARFNYRQLTASLAAELDSLTASTADAAQRDARMRLSVQRSSGD